MAQEFKCPQCGANLEIKNLEKAKMLYCPYCNSEIDLTSGTTRSLSQFTTKPLAPQSDLKLGLIGEFDGVKYQIIGRIRYKDVKSYYWWDEWLLLSEDGRYLWLQEEDWDFVLMRKYTPKVPVDPSSVKDIIEIDGYRLLVEDKGICKISFFEGELTWKAKVGEFVHYLDAYKDEVTLYSCEWTENEIQFFIGEEISVEDVYNAFNLGEPPPAALEEDEITETPFQKFTQKLIEGPAFKLTLIFGLLTALTSLILGFVGTPIRGKRYHKTDQYVISGPFKFSQKNKIYKLDIKVDNLRNDTAYLEFQILDKNGKEIASFDGEFWAESGTEGGEYWHEESLNKTVYFLLKTPGEYTIKVTRENKKRKMPDVRIKAIEGVFDTRLLWSLSLLLLVYPMGTIFLWLIAHSIAPKEVYEEDEDD